MDEILHYTPYPEVWHYPHVPRVLDADSDNTRAPSPLHEDVPELIYESDEEGARSRFNGFIVQADYAGEFVMAPASAPETIDADRVGPHPSYIETAIPYISQATIQECLSAAGVSEAKDDSIRLQGVAWIDSVRKALQLPIKTYDTACVYYQKFRLKHPDSNGYIDAAAAALFAACKIDDTLKKSKEILCAAYNTKLSPAEQLTADDSLFENHAKTIIGLERLMLEAAGFDFRNRYPQEMLIKLVRLHMGNRLAIGNTAYSISLDVYRTYIPLKQITSTMVMACLELSARLLDQPLQGIEGNWNYGKLSTSRQEVMETMLDLLDLYTHHKSSTLIGPVHALETFISIRIALNQEASSKEFPRYRLSDKTTAELLGHDDKLTHFSRKNKAKNDATPTTSPRDDLMKDVTSPTTNGASKPGLKEGTVRFMLDPQRAAEEKKTVGEFFKVEEEEYEVEVEVERKVEDGREKRRP